MPPDNVRHHPHLFDPNAASIHDFITPRPGRGKAISLQARDRAQHAARLLGQMEDIEAMAAERIAAQKAEGVDAGNGVYLQFDSEPGFDLKFESLDFAPSGIELCSVRRSPIDRLQATVFVPDGKLSFFLNRITAYRDDDTNPKKDGSTQPKNRDLVESIADIRLAALEALWTDDPELYPVPDQDVGWEVWLRKSDKLDHLQRFREIAAAHDLTVSEESISFIDRVIVLVSGTGRNLARSTELLGAIAELRLPKTAASFFTQMNSVEQQDWVDDLAGRLLPPDAASPYVCLLDTGVNRGHTLLAPLLADADLHTYKPDWGVDDRGGHGTPMAGIAAYGDLTDALASAGQWPATHQLESVKIINDADPHDPELYGAVTSESVNRVEVNPERRRIFCMAISTPDGRDRGRPSSWSAAVDSLASGADDQVHRLVILAAGNTAPTSRGDYPNSNLTDGIHDPGQAWNALTVGGYTEKALVDQQQFPGWEALAAHSDLAPASCTSMTWKRTRWPVKPDVVFEAGNMARHADFEEPDYIDDALQLLSTPSDFARRRPLSTFGDTSAAAALAARQAAMLWAKYPNLTPEAIRALIVHSAQWTEPMLQRFTDPQGQVDYEAVMRCFGFGVPRLREVLSSADNSLTLIAQGSIKPFQKIENDVKYRELKLHALPWPKDALEALQDTQVTLRITLSYFVEPNPGDRGWATKYGYQSHGLRFAVKRASETVAGFQERINKAARDEAHDGNHTGESGMWTLGRGQTLTTVGSIHSNIWTGTAADLAARGHIAVFPTYGWWNKRPRLNAWNKTSNYALIVTIKTPETDIYTPVANIIDTPIVIET
ncbi:S8 family peptidase [Marivibrio halodurans]|uniref:S8 family peptidase n=1 Tax=Marivibrio halodurans TaxID=2039722 RepID=A0A8J7V0D7_9PROT|nr:S8 family peptidase [Marivibrio halodurans]MBP5856696.1 S8 family peptidase [Marivibrio halodurans]